MEIRHMLSGKKPERTTGLMDSFWLIILQIGIIDIVFSLDTVFTAVGLANRVEVMIAAIVVSVLVMMMVSSAVSGIIERHPTIKGLALVFMVLVGVSLMAESVDLEIPRSYLYFAMAVSAAVVWINMRFRA
jgi:predicted tellurium resistance membrane protein TerC